MKIKLIKRYKLQHLYKEKGTILEVTTSFGEQLIKKGIAELEKQFNALHKSIKGSSGIDSKNLSGADLKKVIAGIKEVESAQKSRIKTTNDLSKAEKEAFSEATMYSFFVGPSLTPITNGRMPRGSLNASNPKPVIKATTA